MSDVTGAPPLRRMAVVRGAVALPAAPPEAVRGSAQAAATLAVRQAPLQMPGLHPFQPTHVALDWVWRDGALEATLTVQGWARAAIAPAALAGLLAALLEAAGPSPGSLRLDVVQEVVG